MTLHQNEVGPGCHPNCSTTSGLLVNLSLRDTRARAVRNVLGNAYPKISGMNSVSNLILEVKVRGHKVQGMTEAFTDTLYSRAKTSSSVSQKAVLIPLFSSETADKFARNYTIEKLPSCPAPCDSAPPPPESSCSLSSYSSFLVSELKYTFHTARARVSRNLKW